MLVWNKFVYFNVKLSYLLRIVRFIIFKNLYHLLTLSVILKLISFYFILPNINILIFYFEWVYLVCSVPMFLPSN